MYAVIKSTIILPLNYMRADHTLYNLIVKSLRFIIKLCNVRACTLNGRFMFALILHSLGKVQEDCTMIVMCVVTYSCSPVII